MRSDKSRAKADSPDEKARSAAANHNTSSPAGNRCVEVPNAGKETAISRPDPDLTLEEVSSRFGEPPIGCAEARLTAGEVSLTIGDLALIGI